jgi:hypothetical protein
LELSRRLDDPRAIAQTAMNMADLALSDGDLHRAEHLIDEAGKHGRQIAYHSIIAGTLALEAMLALHRDDVSHAAECVARCLQSGRAADHLPLAVILLAAAATVASEREEPERAAALWAAFSASNARLGGGDPCGAARLRDRWMPKARSAIADNAWRSAWENGAALSPAKALETLVRAPWPSQPTFVGTTTAPGNPTPRPHHRGAVA